MPQNNLKILAVDDESLILWALEKACAGRALDITTANGTEQAFAALDLHSYDLFLLDLDLKDLDRYELLQAIDERFPYVPVIVMTAADTRSCELNDRIRATRRHGAWHLLEKPFNLDRLLGFIEVVLHDCGNVRVSLNALTQHYESEKRQLFRRSHVQPVRFTFESRVEGAPARVTARGILTDISDGGSGILAHDRLQPDQPIRFEDEGLRQDGVVSWSEMIEDGTFRYGVKFM